MISVVNETVIDPENSKIISAESSCLTFSQRSNSFNSAPCSNEKVKAVAEINEKCNILVVEQNDEGNYLKRNSCCEDKNDSKRARLSEDSDGPINTCKTPEQSSNEFVNKNDDTWSNSDCVTDLRDNQSIIKIKSEPEEAESNESMNVDFPSGSGAANTIDIKRAVKIEKGDTSSSSRESCRFGIRCYRRNPVHRVEQAHPGDIDYKRPNYPPPPKGTPDCPYGNLCYRRNPVHFEQFNHPPETNFEQNYKNYRLRARQRQQEQPGDNFCGNSNDSELDNDYDLDDPFINDEELDSDYLPSSTDEDDDDYDACDRVEE